MNVCAYVVVRVHMYVCGGDRMCAGGGQSSVFIIFFYYAPNFFRQDLSPNPELSS